MEASKILEVKGKWHGSVALIIYNIWNLGTAFLTSDTNEIRWHCEGAKGVVWRHSERVLMPFSYRGKPGIHHNTLETKHLCMWYNTLGLPTKVKNNHWRIISQHIKATQRQLEEKMTIFGQEEYYFSSISIINWAKNCSRIYHIFRIKLPETISIFQTWWITLAERGLTPTMKSTLISKISKKLGI